MGFYSYYIDKNYEVDQRLTEIGYFDDGYDLALRGIGESIDEWHARFKEFLNEDDIVFILYVLTNRGMNIRNNIAHSFYRYENYSVSLMILLITILLRLSKFDINEN